MPVASAEPVAAPPEAGFSEAKVWEANRKVLRERHPGFARELEAAVPVALAWESSRSGPLVASRDGSLLGSRFDPATEAVKQLACLDDPDAAVVVLIGAGLGQAVAEALKRLRGAGRVVVMEPDPAQLAAVLRRIDATAWLADPALSLLGPAADQAALSAALEADAVSLTQGTRLVAHPLTRRLHPDAVSRLGADVAAVTAAARTNLATAMVHAQRTQRNLAENLPVYAAGATTEPLRGAAAGRVAVCVAAGPSLARNAHLLADPAARKRLVVIAAQTALRPLLDRGIEPDFVTALDHSAACARFYEGLPPLPGVTLVAEPTAHPVILRSFPGPVRLTRGDQAEAMLGPGTRPVRTAIPPGATVAHLSVSLAEFLGCSTIVLVGQDLGFTDGLYYCPGTAAHRVWEAELSPWNTLEMMEWQRIARMRGSLQRREGVGGRPCLTDGQMSAYLQQFERSFARMTAAGLRVIDASEGGLVKAHTEVATLADTLAAVVDRSSPPVRLPRVPASGLDPAALQRLDARLREIRPRVEGLKEACGEGARLLGTMAGKVGDPAALDAENRRLRALQARVHHELADAQALVTRVNVTGAVRRQRADGRMRRAGVAGDDKVRAELARDRDHLGWLAQACEETLRTLEVAAAALAEAVAVPGAVAAPGAAVPGPGAVPGAGAA